MNSSKISNSEFCQNCANCCKQFSFFVNNDFALRFKWTFKEKIKTKKSFNPLLTHILIEIPCKHLKQKKGKYYCRIWSKKRPNLCEGYPDMVLREAKTSKDLKKIIKIESKTCPLLKKYSFKEIEKMLK